LFCVHLEEKNEDVHYENEKNTKTFNITFLNVCVKKTFIHLYYIHSFYLFLSLDEATTTTTYYTAAHDKIINLHLKNIHYLLQDTRLHYTNLLNIENNN